MDEVRMKIDLAMDNEQLKNKIQETQVSSSSILYPSIYQFINLSIYQTYPDRYDYFSL